MYRLAQPHDDLTPFIENYWMVFPDDGQPVDLRVEVYVDARADLVFNFRDPYSRTRVGEQPVLHRKSNVDAQRLYPMVITQRGDVSISGVRFRVGGLSAFTDIDLSSITGATAPVEQVFGPEAVELESSLRATEGDLATHATTLDSFFRKRFTRGASLDSFRRGLALLSSESPVSLSDAREQLGVSDRTLTRLFDRFLGIPPKVFTRIVRFQRGLAMLMGDPGMSLGDLAALCGYYDQAHFIKEFREFTGGVPRGYKGYYPEDGPTDFAPNVVRFLQDREDPYP